MRRRFTTLTAAGVIALAGSIGTAPATTWVDITPNMSTAPMRIGYDHTNPADLFLGSWGEGLYRSTDGGQTWTQNYNDFFEGEGVASILVVDADFSPTNPTLGVAVTISGVYVSADGGGSWTRDVANHTGSGGREGRGSTGAPTLFEGPTGSRSASLCQMSGFPRTRAQPSTVPFLTRYQSPRRS